MRHTKPLRQLIILGPIPLGIEALLSRVTASAEEGLLQYEAGGFMGFRRLVFGQDQEAGFTLPQSGMLEIRHPDGRMSRYPPVERWDDWVEWDAKAWPRKVARRYTLVPTICFNCESACGLLAYVDTTTYEIRRFEGNPAHPGSRGRNCAKGPATHNQIYDPERILYPLKRVGPRGSGKWKRVSWDEANREIADELYMAVGTVKRHINHIYGKLGVGSRTQAIAKAQTLGLLSTQT